MDNDPVLDASPGDFILNYQRQTTAAAIGSLNEDPEKAARAMELSRATDVPAPVIHGDLENFETQHKAALTTSLLNNNDYLRQFIASDPMHPKMYNQQYANLDEASQKVSSLTLATRMWDLAKSSATAMMNPPPGSDVIEQHISNEDLREHPVLSSIVGGLARPAATFFAGLQDDVHAITENIAKAGAALGAEKFGKEMAGLVEAEAMGMTGRHGLHGPETYIPGRTWLENQREPPPNVIPEYDQFVAQENKEHVDKLGELIDASAEPREIDPQSYSDFIDQHRPGEFTISGDAALRLYGDKPPTSDDGVLGWVPNIEEQLNLARTTGSDISVPISKAAAFMEGDVFKELQDDIRMTPRGITVNEAKVAKEQEQTGQLVVARQMPDGTTQVGEPGQIHADLVEPDYWEKNTAPPPIDSMGFADKTGKFLSREEAYDFVKTNEPDRLSEQAYRPHFQAEHYNNQGFKPAEPLNGAVPQVRAASALEPLLSVGDRKLELQKRPGIIEGDAFGADQWRILDENGNKVGHLEITPHDSGKKLYVDNVLGLNGLGPRDFGPALIRHLREQIKAEYPNAQQIGGFRISGMREKFGTEREVWMSLDRLDDAGFRQLLEGGQWETFSPITQAYIKPDFARSEEANRLVRAVNDELDRIVPKKVAIQAADTIKIDPSGGLEGQRKGEDIRAGGTYIRYKETYPIILYALDSENALGAARHEAIHHLRQYGFFNNEEWGTLEAQALAGGWLKKYNIDRRYPEGNPTLKLEEAVTEAYQDWAKQKDTLGDRARQLMGIESPLDTIFRKMQEFFDRIRERVGALLGKDPTWEDIFQKVDTGEVGGREGTEPLDARAFNEKLSVEGGSRPYERANSFGLPVTHFREYDKLLQSQYASDLKFATDRAMKEQAQEKTKQWKEDRKALRVEVAASIRQRPDVAADLFFGSGELYGKKVPMASVKMDASKLAPEQKAGLPRAYYGEHGLNPDEAASLFGYPSGDAMVQRLTEYNAAKISAGKMSAKDFVSRVTDIETDRQMHLTHGVLEDNIMDAAKEHALSETAQDVVHQETLMYHAMMNKGKAPDGIALGQQEQPASQANIKAAVREAFRDVPLRTIDSQRMMAKIGAVGRQIEGFHRAEDWASAFKLAQQREYMMTVAQEMIKVEKAQKKFDKITKSLGRPFDPQKKQVIDPAYSLMMRDIMSKIEKPYGMSVQGKAEAMSDLGYRDLADFVDKFKHEYGEAGLELPVPDFLYDKDFKKNVKDLSVDEFGEVNDAIVALNTMGRSIHKINKAGEKAELAEVIKEGNEQLAQKFPAVSKDYASAEGGPGAGRRTLAAMTTAETILARFDGRDPYGHFTQLITYPGARAANIKDKLTRDFSAKWDKLPELVDPNKKLDTPLRDPTTGQRLGDFTRANLMTIIHNMGNDYNWRIFTRGWAPKDIAKDGDAFKAWQDGLKAWVESVATPEMFDRAQAMGKIFGEGFDMTRNVYASIYGIPPERIPLRPQTLGGKEYEGWYHPLIRDEIRSPLDKDDPANPVFKDFWPSTANAYTKRRSGAVYTLSLSQDMIPLKMNQMLHDIAFREFVHNTAKLFRNDAFKRGVSTHYGPEYMETLGQWLKNIAGNASYDSTALAELGRLSSVLRQNVVATYIGFSATTVEKHGLTALVFSAAEGGGVKRFAKAFAETTPSIFRDAVMDIFGKSPDLGSSLTKFIENASEEIGRRDQNFRETVTGAHDVSLGRSTARQEIIKMGSKAVAFSDRISADPTWWARYQMAIEETGGDLGLATDVANRAVRRAHGSTSVTNQPTIVMGKGILDPWLHTIYGFWGTKLQRTIELAHDVNDAYRLGRGGELKEAASMLPNLLARTAVFVFWPAVVEQIVQSQFEDDHNAKKTFLNNALTMALGTPAMSIAQSIIGVRDLAYGIEHSREPQVGLISSPLHDVTQLVRDVRKNRPFDRQNAGKLIQDAITVSGDLTGLAPKHVGTALHYFHDVVREVQKPKSAEDVYRGVITGEQQKRKVQ